MESITFFNKNFRFVFTPKENEQFVLNLFQTKSDKRFLIGAGSIAEYITKKNAETVLKTAEKMKVDKTTLKFRKYGKVEIYVK